MFVKIDRISRPEDIAFLLTIFIVLWECSCLVGVCQQPILFCLNLCFVEIFSQKNCFWRRTQMYFAIWTICKWTKAIFFWLNISKKYTPNDRNQEKIKRLEWSCFHLFFHQQNILRQPIKFYDIEFSANNGKVFTHFVVFRELIRLFTKYKKAGKSHIWFCLTSVKMMLFSKHLTYIEMLTSVRKYLSVKICII